jgi:hypothetical protein
MKTYQLHMSVSILEGQPGSYSPPQPVTFEIKEALPVNVEPQRYIKSRLAEEVKRHFDALTTKIDNMTDEAAAELDPLA